MSRPAALPVAGPRGTRVAAPRLAAVATALPEHRVPQAEARALIAAMFAGALGPGDRLLQVFDHAGIEARHVCMPLDWYRTPRDFGARNDVYVERGLALSATAAARALAAAGVAARAVDHVVFVSSTGLATPSLDARLANRLGMRADVRRTPLWGLGCAGGVAGLARARDFALADPGARVLLVAVELCSLAFQHHDRDTRNVVAASLFSDGAAAALVEGPSLAAAGTGGLALEAAGSTLWPDTLDVMGWTVDDLGLHVVFSRDIPAFVRARVRASVDGFLAAHGLGRADVAHVVAHPGGPKVLAALGEALELPAAALAHARAVLREAGNMSSPTCLFALERALAAHDFAGGERVLMAALGPGFALEQVLLRHHDPADVPPRGDGPP